MDEDYLNGTSVCCSKRDHSWKFVTYTFNMYFQEIAIAAAFLLSLLKGLWIARALGKYTFWYLFQIFLLQVQIPLSPLFLSGFARIKSKPSIEIV